ncbi:MAG: AMP-binding protein [Candidatus Latescibacterota bacterium]|nr:MAG: AMP-binding protein [Candidatus Latescibacterota bacterium]
MRPTVTREELSRLGIDATMSREILDKLNAIPRDTPPAAVWREVSRSVLSADIPFVVHSLLFETIFASWDHSHGPPPVWIPSEQEIRSSNVAAFCKKANISRVSDLHAWSAENRSAFWETVVDILGIRFRKSPKAIVDLADGIEMPRWLVGARLNIAESCFQAPGDALAVVYQPEGGAIQRATYAQLDRLSNRVANSLLELGIKHGDRIAIAMPMTLEAVAAYLGIVKAGFAVVSIADSFAAEEMATRLRIADTKAVVTQDVVLRAGKTLPMYEKVVDAGAKTAIVVLTRDSTGIALRENDIGWDSFLVENDVFDAIPCDPDEVINILFSSGTTGDPKAIPWTQTTPIKCAMDGFLHHDITPGEVVVWPTNLGWMMGPWLIFATLVNRGTMALYYGAAVTREFCEFVQNVGVKMLGVVPSLVKAWRKADTVRGLDWSSIKAFSSTGEVSNPDDYLYLMSLAGYRPVIEYCGGTEIGGGYISGTIVQPASPSTFTTPSFGLDFCILDESGKPARSGELFIIPPSIGLSNTLLNRDHHEVYYAGTPRGPNGELLRRHGDETEALPGGYYRGRGRADDTMNLGGIKVSSSEIERTLNSVDGLFETAAIAVDPPGGGPSRLVIYLVPEPGADLKPETVKKDMQRAIATGLNPLFKIHDVRVVDTLPRTASNKVMRRALREGYAKNE